MIIFKSVEGEVETSMSIDKDAQLSVVVDSFIKFLQCAGYECDKDSIRDILEE